MKLVVLPVLILALSLLVHLPQPLFAQDEAAQSAEAQGAVAQEVAPSVNVQDAAICQQVVDRTPMGTGDVFSPDVPELYCFTRIVGAQVDTEVTHNWYYKGNLMASVVLPVGSASWRTWSKKQMSPDMVGEWMVEILSAEGVPLESIIFFLQ
jgi:hypothetical protein